MHQIWTTRKAENVERRAGSAKKGGLLETRAISLEAGRRESSLERSPRQERGKRGSSYIKKIKDVLYSMSSRSGKGKGGNRDPK